MIQKRNAHISVSITSAIAKRSARVRRNNANDRAERQRLWREKNHKAIRKRERARWKKRSTNQEFRAKRAVLTRLTQNWQLHKDPEAMTVEQYLASAEAYGYKCAYCGMDEDTHIQQFNIRMESDHIIARNNAGRNHVGNHAMACHLCNSGKGDLDLPHWLARHGKCLNDIHPLAAERYLNQFPDADAA